METTLTPETDAEARLMTLVCDDSCIDVYIERDDKNVDGDFVLADFARKLERERDEARIAITDLTQRLQERQESFQAQLIRIEDTWREKLVESQKRTMSLQIALNDAIKGLQEWCDDVDADASWDGWDSHFKYWKWEGIKELKAALEPSK